MRILVIEDDEEIGAFLKRGLTGEGFTIDLIPNGEKGSYIARTNKYDLIILDYILPDKDGFSICNDIRSSGITTPILMLSVRSEVVDKTSCLNAGADDYLTKPFSFQELTARVHAILRRPQHIEKDILQIEDLILDRNKCVVTRGGQKIPLTRKEFMLLECLMTHQGNVVSRGTILEEIWDLNADPFSNTIETHIANLRKKIDGNNSEKLIHTIHGRGYKVDVS